MQDNYYTIVVRFKTKHGKEEVFKKFLTSIVDVALQSPGCMKHDLHQSLNDSSEFMFYENWINKEAHEKHIARPEVKQWRDQLNDYLEIPYTATFWEKI